MAANGFNKKGNSYQKGHWGKWNDKQCTVEECNRPARCKGMCDSHYNKKRWADGHRSPSCNPESRRQAHLRHRYGIDTEQYQKMFDEQGGVCSICKEFPEKEK